MPPHGAMCRAALITPLLRLSMPASGRFQSTPPVRGATGRRVPKIKTKEFQSTPPVRGATKKTKKYKPCSYHLRDFNPRSPCGERRVFSAFTINIAYISIHAPRAGSDYPMLRGTCKDAYFNPRSPCGERHHL